MRLVLDEEEQSHLYSCLLAGGKVWANMKKGLEKLERPTTEVDRELEINAKLRMQLNPKAEEIAREKERAKDKAQQDWTAGEGVSSGETGGGHQAGEIVKLRLNGEDTVPTDEHIRDALLLRNDLVLLSDIASWTSSERESVVKYLNTDIGGEAPECLDFVRLTSERIGQLIAAGPYMVRKNTESEVRGESYTVVIPEDATIERLEAIEGEYTDGVEAEVKAARMNRELVKHADIADDLVQRWLAVGPWRVEAEADVAPEGEQQTPSRWFVGDGTGTRERSPSEKDAAATAAKYNRTIAGKDEFGEWRTPPELSTEGGSAALEGGEPSPSDTNAGTAGDAPEPGERGAEQPESVAAVAADNSQENQTNA